MGFEIALAMLNVGLQAAAVGVGISGALIAAQAESDAYKEQAKVAKLEGNREADRLRKLNAIRLRRMRESIGASGVRADVGTAIDVVIDQAGEAEVEALNARFQGIYAASVYKAAAKNAKQAGNLQAWGLGISGTASILGGALQGASLAGGGGTATGGGGGGGGGGTASGGGGAG